MAIWVDYLQAARTRSSRTLPNIAATARVSSAVASKIINTREGYDLVPEDDKRFDSRSLRY